MPEFAFPNIELIHDRNWLREQGYSIWPDGPEKDNCLWRDNLRAAPYAYALPVDEILDIETDWQPYQSLALQMPYAHLRDVVVVAAQSGQFEERILVARETAFPGWHVVVDGQPAELEVFGGYIAVTLPPDGAVHEVIFYFRPVLAQWGGTITMLTCLFIIAYLLRLDELGVRRWWQGRSSHGGRSRSAAADEPITDSSRTSSSTGEN